MDIIFFGTADFGLPALASLVADGHRVKAVVTNPARPAGRGRKLRPTPVAKYCEEQGISPVLTPENLSDESFLDELKGFEAELFVVVAFSILPEVLFAIPPHGTYNIHAALLPLFRGPAPIQRAIETGANSTGVTLFRIDAQIDTGNIVLQKELIIGESETTPELYERLSALGGVVLSEGITYIADPQHELSAQNHSMATKAPLLKKSEGHIDWSLSALEISRKVRAFKPFPSTYAYIDKKRLGIETVEVLLEESDAEDGTVLQCGGGIVSIACGSGVLSLIEVKPEGKRKMFVADYLNGSALEEGSRLI